MSLLSVVLNEWTLLLFIVLFIIYKHSVSTHDFFKKKNLPYIKPLPYFGNLIPFIFKRKSFLDFIVESCRIYKNEKWFGIFEGRNPLLVLNDPDQIKNVTVKDFDHFVNHRTFFNPESDPLLANSLFSLTDQKWKDMRATLSPAFTGSKMRLMFELIEEVSKTALGHMKNEAVKQDPLDVDMKDFCSRFATDVIASVAFGLKINSLEEKDNEFYLMGRKASNFNVVASIKIFLLTNFPRLMNFFKIRLFDQKYTDYFNRLVLDTIKYRTEHGIIRPDMINLLMEPRTGGLTHDEQEPKETEGFATVEESNLGKKPSKRNWTDDEIVANCFLFFLAGFDNVSTLICFCAHELMENHEIQKRLIEEVDDMNAELDGNPLTYDKLQQMKYLDMVMSETLRKWASNAAVDRVCVKPYTLIDEKSGKSVSVNVGDVVWIPIIGMHYNSEFYPNPERFDPDRFGEQNKRNIKPFSYLPFGIGPRNCIGSRFALMETKIAIFHLLTSFTFERSPKMLFPFELQKGTILLAPKGGFWLRFKPRKIDL